MLNSFDPVSSTLFPGLQRLISFALANPEFAAHLIANPDVAIADIPTAIALSDEELHLLRQVRSVTSLHGFAAHMHILIQDALLDPLEQAAN